jgi:hypothetical protein
VTEEENNLLTRPFSEEECGDEYEKKHSPRPLTTCLLNFIKPVGSSLRTI